MLQMRMGELKNKVKKADKQNEYDRTDDVVGTTPATTNVDEAVEAMTSHINKYDLPDELEDK
jgi:oligoendopeptidase F